MALYSNAITRLYKFVLPIIVVVLGIQITIITFQNRELKKSLDAKWTSASKSPFQIKPTEPIKPGTALSSFTLADTEGLEHTVLPEQSDKDTLLLVFSTTCPACKKNSPTWKDLTSKMDSSKWNIYGLSISELDQAKVYAQEHEFDFPILGLKDATEIKQQLKISRIPTTIAVDQDQKVIKSWIGILESRRKEVEETLGIKE